MKPLFWMVVGALAPLAGAQQPAPAPVVPVPARLWLRMRRLLLAERREDVVAEAYALLTDPRDTIESVYVWSEPEQQHITTIRRPA